MEDALTLFICVGALGGLFYAIYRARKSLKKGGGKITSLFFGSTHYLQTLEQRESAKMMIEEKAGEIEEKDDSGEQLKNR